MHAGKGRQATVHARPILAAVLLVALTAACGGAASSKHPTAVAPAPAPATVSAPAPPPSAAAAPPQRIAGPQDRWALLVGVTRYRAPVHPTTAGAQDIGVIRGVLLQSGWRPDHIRTVTDGAATGEALAAGLSWLSVHSTDTTFSLFHYSGHVKQRDGHEYLWPVDNAFFPDTSLATAMKKVRGVSWTDVAGCEAAGFDQDLSSKTRLVTASSAVSEKSYEYPPWRTSVWVGLLFDQGLRTAAADLNGDGHVSVQEAYRWGAPQAAKITSLQVPYGPQHPYRAGGDGDLRLDAPVVG